MRALVLLELRRSFLKWAAPLIAVLVVVAANGITPAGVSDWKLLAQACAATAVLVAPIAAGLAFVASATRYSRETLSRLRGATEVTAGVLAHFAATGAWLLFGYIAGGIAVNAVAVVTQPSGYWQPLWYLSTIGGIALSIATGYLLGQLSGRRPWFAPVVAGVIYLGFLPLQSIRQPLTWISRLYFFADDQADVFTKVSQVSLGLRLGWFLAATALALFLVLRLTTRSGGRERTRLLAVLLAVAAVCVGGLAVTGGRLTDGVERPSYKCLTLRATHLCATDAFQRGLPAIEARFDHLFDAVGSVYRPASRVEQGPIVASSAPPTEPQVFYLYDLSGDYASRAVGSYIDAYLFPTACTDGDSPFTSIVYKSWLAGLDDPFAPGRAEPSLVSAASRFYHASESERVAWLASHWRQAKSCTVSIAQLASIGSQS